VTRVNENVRAAWALATVKPASAWHEPSPGLPLGLLAALLAIRR
jgi:MYXO-CTERM domain-containing protein